MTNDELNGREISETDLAKLEIPIETATLALEQAEARLSYMLGRKDRFEDRALALLRMFLTLALAIVGFGVGLAKYADEMRLVWPAIWGSLPLFTAAGALVMSLWDRPLGSLGSAPEVWLGRDCITADEAGRAHLLARVVLSYRRRIDSLRAANKKALRYIRIALCVAASTPIAMGVATACLAAPH